MHRRHRLAALLLAVLLVAAGCGGDDDAARPADEADDAPTVATATPQATEAATAAPEPDAPDEPTDDTPEPTTEPTTEPVDAPDPTATPAPASDDFSALDPIVTDYLAANELNGAGLVIVDREDGVVHEAHWGVFDPDRVSLVASSSKMITAGVLLSLQDQGLLDIDAPVADVTGWDAGPNTAITTAQLLSNSSGLVGLLPDPAYGPYLCQYLAQGTLADCGEGIFTSAIDDADVVPPDTEFRYGGGQWQVAGAVAEAVSGRSWAELVEEIYVEPCGLETLTYNNHFAQLGSGFDYPTAFDGDPSVLTSTENPNMEGGVYVNTGDYATLLLLHLRDGRCGDTQVLSPEALDLMHQDRIGEVYGGDAWNPGTGYGMGWWVDRSTGRLTDPGAYGAVPWLDLEDGYGAYLVVEATGALGQGLAALLFDPVDAAMTAG